MALPIAGSESGSDGRNPIHWVPPSVRNPGMKRLAFASIAARTREIRRCIEAGELHRAADAHAAADRRDDEAVAAEDQLAPQIEGARRQRRVVAALGFQWNVFPERAGEAMRPCTGRDDHAARGEG